MRNRRWAIAGLGLVVSLGLAVAGCGTNDGDGGGNASSPTPAIPADPKKALTESVKGVADGNFSFTVVDHESTTEGSVHEPSKSAQLTAESKPGAEVDMTIGFIIIDQERWVKMEFGPELAEVLKMPDGWLHVDPAKLKDAKTLEDMSIKFGDPEETDPANVAKVLKGLVTAEKTGDGEYSGTVDLSKSPAKDAGMVSDDVVSKLGAKAKEIPFTASLDGQGRLTRFTLQMPAAGEIKAHKSEVTFSDYGSASEAKKPPAGESQEAPASVYEILNS